MAKGVYFGVDNKARKCKKLYFGVDNIARKVKKMYFGVNGQARICYSAGLTMLSNVGQLDYITYSSECSKVGNYMLHARAYDNVKTLNKDWVVGTATNFNYNRRNYSGSWNPNYALFCGGNGEWNSDNIDAYDSSLVRTSTARLGAARGGISVGNIGIYAVTAGGFAGWGGSGSSVGRYEFFDNSLVRVVDIYDSRVNRSGMGIARTDSYIILAGGMITNSGTSQAVDTAVSINASGVLNTITSLPQVLSSTNGANSRKYAFIMTKQGRANVFAYSNNLTLNTLPQQLYSSVADNFINIGDDAVAFGGGRENSIYPIGITIFNDNLVMSVSEEATLIDPIAEPRAFNFNNSGIVGYLSNGVNKTFVYQN